MLTADDYTVPEMAELQRVLVSRHAEHNHPLLLSWLSKQSAEHARFEITRSPRAAEYWAEVQREYNDRAEEFLREWRTIQLNQINQEALKMTTTPQPQPRINDTAEGRPTYQHGQQPRPPIPPTAPESKSAGVIAVENLTARVNILANQAGEIDAKIYEAIKAHTATSERGYNELRSEIALIRGMVESIAAQLAQAQPSELDAHFGSPKITAAKTSADFEEIRKANATNGENKEHCSIHDCKMYRHESEDGAQVWYSHKTADGKWCRGKAKKA